MQHVDIAKLKEKLYRPRPDSHKGENGRLLVIGGSELFHASIFWAADVASRIVDLVHFASPAEENNVLVRQKLKAGFWNGIVVPFERVEEYIEEDDCVLIGPGMPRDEGLHKGERSTGEVVNELVGKFPNKKWVIDGGALQEIDPRLLNENMIITPHHREWERLMIKNEEILRQPGSSHLAMRAQDDRLDIDSLSSLSNEGDIEKATAFSMKHGGVTVLLKGVVDVVCRGGEVALVVGGNAGMTKGGTGDVLAGLVAALYCKNDAMIAAQVGSVVMKRAGEALETQQGIYFNASDMVEQVARELARI